jgi:hypothetical protein
MLSKNAFLAALALSTGAMTLHDLRRTLGFQGLAPKEKTESLLEGLAELCRNKLVVWQLELDYGNSPAQKPSDFGESTFLRCWQEHISKSDLAVEVPDCKNPTIFLEAIPALRAEIDNTCYDNWKRAVGW